MRPAGKRSVFFAFRRIRSAYQRADTWVCPYGKLARWCGIFQRSVGNGLGHSTPQTPGLQPFPNPTTPSPRRRGAHCAPGGKVFCFFAFRRIRSAYQRADTWVCPYGKLARWCGIFQRSVGNGLGHSTPQTPGLQPFPNPTTPSPRRRGAHCAPGGKVFCFFAFRRIRSAYQRADTWVCPYGEVARWCGVFQKSVGNGLDHSASQTPGLQPFPNPTTPSPMP